MVSWPADGHNGQNERTRSATGLECLGKPKQRIYGRGSQFSLRDTPSRSGRQYLIFAAVMCFLDGHNLK
jgi:hypothetical protein